MFFRNFIRAADLIPFIMGTNTHVVDMPSFTDASGNSQLPLWAYLITELPKYPESLLKEKFAILKTQRPQYQKDFLSKFQSVVIHERPLFASRYIEALEQNISNLSPSKESRSDLLRKILMHGFEEFNTRKKI